ncbi:pentatricopeptide repeat-containing protein At1g25360 [Lolium perenne]|uniref:pentatricopeptide repeat-containing protein At1g25360 n=1 Tax=Lolium perenne TaxID=4522 RepID=UPI0021EA5695|nr:pentatricopeptide repeat-containing protein At1g25360 [Lolium perenne]
MPPRPPPPPAVAALPYQCSVLLRNLAARHSPVPTAPSSFLRALRCLHARLLTAALLHNPSHPHLTLRLLHLYTISPDLATPATLFRSDPGPIAATSLVSAYAIAGRLPDAVSFFDSVPLARRDTVLHNAMISAFARASLAAPAFSVFRSLLASDSRRPDDYSYTGLLSAAGQMHNLAAPHCTQLHGSVLRVGTGAVLSVSNALIALYMKCDAPEVAGDARKVLDEMPVKDVLTWTTILVGYVRKGDVHAARSAFEEVDGEFDVLWNAMISGYVQSGMHADAFELFRKMVSKRIPPDEFTFTSVLSACANGGFFRHGRSVHGQFIRLQPDFVPEAALPVNNALVTLYSKSGKISVAAKIFDCMSFKDVVSWNTILSGYIECGCLDSAARVFKEMPYKSELSWMVMVSGYLHGGLAEDALKLFNQMRSEDVKPCDYTYAGAVAACGELGALKHGKQLHAHIVQCGFEASNSAGNALLTMYARCGAVKDARLVFLVMPNVDSVSWNAMISALGQHGYGTEALELFDKMVARGIYPDWISFLTILTACNHAGLVEEGFQYFESMKRDFGICPGEDHYARLIDLLGRAGRIGEARDLIKTMPFEPTPAIWEAILSGCRTSGDMDLGAYAADQLYEMIPQHDGTYILLSNTYSAAGRWVDAARVRKLMRDRGVKKEPGCSWIEVGNKVHVFLVGDTKHPEAHEVYKFLEMVGAKMRKLGYVPDTKFVLQDMAPNQKEYALSAHSEKLAVSFGLLKLPLGATVTVLKNLKICGDCHTAMMFMSLAVGREIVVRDVRRFHHFKDGECSCGNYW